MYKKSFKVNFFNTDFNKINVSKNKSAILKKLDFQNI